MLSTEMIDLLQAGAIYGAPIVAGALALRVGVRSETPGGALARTVGYSILYSIGIGLLFSLIIDASLSGQMWKRWASVWFPLAEIPLGALSGACFGVIALKIVERRILADLRAKGRSE